MQEHQWLTVSETAKILGTSGEMVRRKIREGGLPAAKLTPGARAPWRIDGPELHRQLRADAAEAERRKRLAGVATGYSDQGGPADEAFVAEVERLHGPDTAAGTRVAMERTDLFERLQREMAEDPGLRQQFERLDEAERFEAEARELARRARRAERLRARALELLEDEDED